MAIQEAFHFAVPVWHDRAGRSSRSRDFGPGLAPIAHRGCSVWRARRRVGEDPMTREDQPRDYTQHQARRLANEVAQGERHALSTLPGAHWHPSAKRLGAHTAPPLSPRTTLAPF